MDTIIDTTPDTTVNTTSDATTNITLYTSNSSILDSTNNNNADSSNNSASTSNISYTKQQKIILLSSCIGQFFCNVCVSLPAPFLPKENESHNINSDFTGWILGLLPLVQLVLCPVYGRWMQHLGIHTTFVFGLFFCGGVTILFGLLQYVTLPSDTDKNIDVTYLTLAIILRGGQAVGSAAVITASMTLLTVTFPHNTISILSYSETVIGLGVMSGPAIGSGLFKLGGFMLTFSGCGVIMVISSIFMWFLLPFNVHTTDGEDEKWSLVKIFSHINIVLSLILSMSTGIMWASIEPVLEPELRKKYGLSEEISALTFLLLSVSYSVTAPFIGKALDKFKCFDSMYVMVFGFSLCGVNFLVMGPSPLIPTLERPLWLLLITLSVLGVSLGLMLVPSLELSFGKSDPEDEDSEVMTPSTIAMISGLWSCAYSMGDFVGPTISGIVTEHGSFGWAMTCYTFACLACVILILVVKLYQAVKKSRRRKSSKNSDSINAISDDESEPLLKK